MLITTIAFTLLHFLATVYIYFRNPTNQPKELVIQHHEKCMMLGLIALAVLLK